MNIEEIFKGYMGGNGKNKPSKENPAGTKLLNRIKARTLCIRNKGGVVSDAIREIARDKNLAKLANKQRSS